MTSSFETKVHQSHTDALLDNPPKRHKADNKNYKRHRTIPRKYGRLAAALTSAVETTKARPALRVSRDIVLVMTHR